MMPLIVDLDHTLIAGDLLLKSSIGVLRQNPLLVFIYPVWFLRGKGYLKDQLVKRFPIDASRLKYNQKVIDYIKTRKKRGDQIILATASHKLYAFGVAAYLKTKKTPKNTAVIGKDLFTQSSKKLKSKPLNLFDDVMASNKNFNLSSGNKAAKLVERFGTHGFDYMGDHKRDLPVWEVANLAILVNASDKIIKKTKHLNTLILSKKT